MIDVHELLQMKEDELARVRKEIEALRIVAPLVTEPDGSQASQPDADPEAAADGFGDLRFNQNSLHEESSNESVDVVLHPIAPKRSRLRGWLGRAAGE